MCCCLMAPNHYLNLCWLIISEVIHLRAISEELFYQILSLKRFLKIWNNRSISQETLKKEKQNVVDDQVHLTFFFFQILSQLVLMRNPLLSATCEVCLEQTEDCSIYIYLCQFWDEDAVCVLCHGVRIDSFAAPGFVEYWPSIRLSCESMPDMPYSRTWFLMVLRCKNPGDQFSIKMLT